MNESGVWKTLNKGMTWTAQRIESGLTAKGIPDVYYQLPLGNSGWIELKYIAEIPKRDRTPVRFPHFTVEQKLWLTRFGRAGGRCWIFSRVADTFYLHSWKKAYIIGTITRQQLIEEAEITWHKSIDFKQLAEIL